MADFGCAVEKPHPVAGEHAALGMAHEDHLLRPGDGQDRADVGADLFRGLLDPGGAAVAELRDEHRPPVLPQVEGQLLPDSVGVAGAVDEHHRPRALRAGPGPPVVLDVAARGQAGGEGETRFGGLARRLLHVRLPRRQQPVQFPGDVLLEFGEVVIGHGPTLVTGSTTLPSME